MINKQEIRSDKLLVNDFIFRLLFNSFLPNVLSG